VFSEAAAAMSAVTGSVPRSPRILSLSHEVAPERSAESFRNTSCGPELADDLRVRCKTSGIE
jgi:hypothetical protein